ncbi:MAG: integrase [Firmicutes bacterium]|nr:integrase [Bacillota bacterium]
MLEFYGIYSQLLRQYIDFKRNLGYRYESEYSYRDFDRFTQNQGCKSIGLTKELCQLWSSKRPNESNSNCYRRVSNIRNFSLYLNSLGIKSYVPSQPKKFKTTFIPYIFSHDEIKQFFSACDHLPITGYSNLTWILPAVFRLIYGCGLRVNEALYLKYEDVNIKKCYIIIHNTKNGQDRMLPFTDSVAKVLTEYLQYREKLNTSSEFFFIKKNGDHCSRDAIYRWFRKILYRARISHGGRGYGPRLHDLRHSFSVHSLASMAEKGLDLYYSLPILSKYLGHSSLKATDKYVRLTADMYPEIMNGINSLCTYVFPEVDTHETK